MRGSNDGAYRIIAQTSNYEEPGASPETEDEDKDVDKKKGDETTNDPPSSEAGSAGSAPSDQEIDLFNDEELPEFLHETVEARQMENKKDR